VYLTNADVARLYGQPFDRLTLPQRALSDEFMATRPACSCHRPLAPLSPPLAEVVSARLARERSST
jgi:hypothetical protein